MPRRGTPLTHDTRAKISRANVLTRYRDPQDVEVLDARREAAAARLADYVAATLADAPPLTDEQCERISRLLTTGIRVSSNRGDAA